MDVLLKPELPLPLKMVTYSETYRLLRPTEALHEMYVLAANLYHGVVSSYLSNALDAFPEDAPDQLRTAVQRQAAADRELGSIMATATPFLWSSEMHAVMREAATEYPWEGQKWTTDLLGEIPAYHAHETDLMGDKFIEDLHRIGHPSAPYMTTEDTGIYSSMTYLKGRDIFDATFVASHGVILPFTHPVARLGDAVTRETAPLAGKLEFLRSPYITVLRERASRAERHRLVAAKQFDPEKRINVVVLRRQASTGSATVEGHEIDWSYRWFVRGHWHSYWTGKAERRHLEPRWIAPYVKGPEGKPLKPPAKQVFSVIR